MKRLILVFSLLPFAGGKIFAQKATPMFGKMGQSWNNWVRLPLMWE